MKRPILEQPKCPECQYRKPPSEFRDPGTFEPLPARKHCLRRKQRGGAKWIA